MRDNILEHHRKGEKQYHTMKRYHLPFYMMSISYIHWHCNVVFTLDLSYMHSMHVLTYIIERPTEHRTEYKCRQNRLWRLSACFPALYRCSLLRYKMSLAVCRYKKVLRLEYEAYTPMAIKQLQKLCLDVRSKWHISKMAVAHRTG